MVFYVIPKLMFGAITSTCWKVEKCAKYLTISPKINFQSEKILLLWMRKLSIKPVFRSTYTNPFSAALHKVNPHKTHGIISSTIVLLLELFDHKPMIKWLRMMWLVPRRWAFLYQLCGTIFVPASPSYALQVLQAKPLFGIIWCYY